MSHLLYKFNNLGLLLTTNYKDGILCSCLLIIVKPGVWPAHALFLKIALSGKSVCVCVDVCVSAPEAMKN